MPATASGRTESSVYLFTDKRSLFLVTISLFFITFAANFINIRMYKTLTATLILALMLTLALSSCRHTAAPNAALLHYNADTLIRLDRTAHASPEAASQALQTLHELRQKGNGPIFKLEWVEGNILMRQQKLLQAAECYRAALATDSVQGNPQYYLNLCNNLIQLFTQRERPDSVMRYAQLLLKKVDADHLPQRAKMDAYWAMSQVYATYRDTVNRNETAATATSMAWQTLATRRQSNTAIAHALNKLFDIYAQGLGHAIEEHRTAAADTLGTRLQAIMAEMDTLVLSPRRPDGAPAWLLQQCNSQMGHLMARLCHDTGRTGEERQWVQRMQACASDLRNDAHLAQYYLRTSQYDTAIHLLQGIHHSHQAAEDSINTQHAEACRQLSEAYRHTGRTDEALKWSRYSQVLQDSLDTRRLLSDAIQQSAISHTREQRLRISNQQDVILLQGNRLIALAVISILLAAISFITYLYLQKARRRNRSIVKEMKQQQQQHLAVQQSIDNIRLLEQQAEEQEIAAVHQSQPEDQLPQWLKDKEEKLLRQRLLQHHFNDLQRLMEEQKPYLQPDLRLADVTTTLHIELDELTIAIQEFTGKNFTEYITQLRMDRALYLLEHSDYVKISTVAQESGFGSVRHFYRLFQKMHAMSPTDYRSAVRALDEKND